MTRKDHQLFEKYQLKKSWGLYTSVDLKNCQPNLIRDEKYIKEYVDKLCDLIKMRRFGQPQVVDFGEDPRISGFSMTQLIETSLISGHFANLTNSAYIDIFSCKFYPPQEAAQFTKQFFKAKSMKIKINFRY